MNGKISTTKAGSSSSVSAAPLLTRIKMTTIGAVDIPLTEDWYGTWLGYEVRERGHVSQTLAASWGAPSSSGRRYTLMSSPGAPDVFVRAVETDPVAGYRAMTTLGWNSFEIIVDDVMAVHERLKASPFTILDVPHPLKSIPTIWAMQVLGPSEEVLYLTMQTGDRNDSVLPLPHALVGRPFIVVVAGRDLESLRGWYADRFAMEHKVIHRSPIGLIQRAQGVAPDHEYPLTTLNLGEHGNLIELDEYPPFAEPEALVRPRASGQLPPGNALVSFGVHSLDDLDLPFIAPPEVQDGLGYDGRRAATNLGPVGELIELIEERPAH